jgi:molybdopterin-synthase adenylyltransferase
MMDLRISTSDMRTLRSAVLGKDSEHCAVLFASQACGANGRDRLLVREVALPSEDDYTRQGYDYAELKPAYVARVAKRARLNGLSLVFAHSHLGTTAPHFSDVDDLGERELAAFLQRWGMSNPHAAMVLSAAGVRARLLGQYQEIRVISLGDRLNVEFDPEDVRPGLLPEFDRQIRAFGPDGQGTLQRLKVAVVGLGGTGSIVVQQLVHLGVRDLVLVDPDHVDVTNLNRVVGATHDDAGALKVEVARRYVEQFAPAANIELVADNVVRATVASRLIDADVIFACTDSHGSRSVIQQVAYQYMIPCIDVGSTITTSAGAVTGIIGRVQLLGPDRPCLWCTNLLDSEEVRRDLMNDVERKADPYIQGAHEPAPSVISLNGTVVSLAVTMLLGFATSVPIDARHLIYNALTGTLRPVRGPASADCFICSRKGVFGRGDAQTLFARQD